MCWARVWVVLVRSYLAVVRWGPELVRYARRARQAGIRLRERVARWAPVLAPAARARWLAVHAGQVALAVWRWAEPYVRDAAGWLVHTAPGLLARWLARQLARLVRWLPGATVRALWWACIGAGWLLRHAVRYCVGYLDYAGVLAEAHDRDQPRREHLLRRRWRRAALRRTLTLTGLGLAGWFATVALINRYGGRAELALIVTVVGVLAGIGRAIRPPAPRDPSTEPAQEADPRGPYPLADAHTRAEAAECVTRALAAETIELRNAGEATRTPWGWVVPIVLRSGTPAGIVAKTGELETHLDLPAGGVLATPDRSRRARVVLRLAQSDPFTTLGPAPHRPPRSESITRRLVVGERIDATPLAVPLLGVQAVVIGSPGSGKSSTLLCLADALTACADAVVWDLDPAGDGLRPLGPGVGRRERDPDGIEDALTDAVALAEVRPRMLASLGMGPAWEPTPARPVLVVIVDEYPRLTARAKQLAVALLRTGRKARVTLILAATEATSDALGAAVATTCGLKILHSCRHTDVQLVLGPQMLAEGWRPDRLHPASADDPGDAGCCYVATAGHREPLLCKISPVDLDEAGERGQARAAAGLPHIDPESWRAARTHRATHSRGNGGAASTGNEDDPAGRQQERVDQVGITDVIAAFGGEHRRLWTEDLLTALAQRDPRYARWTGEDLAGVLRPIGVRAVQIWQGGRNRNGYDRDTIAAAFQEWRQRP